MFRAKHCKNSPVGFRGIAVVFASLGTSLAAFASAPAPHLTRLRSSLEECLKTDSGLGADGKTIEGQIEWKLACPPEDFLKRSREEKFRQPVLRLLVGRVIHGEVLRVREEVVQEQLKTQRENVFPKNFGPFGFIEGLLKNEALQEWMAPATPSYASVEGQIVARTKDFVEEGTRVLRPLYVGATPKEYLPYAPEGLLTHLMILGDTLRSSALGETLQAQSALLASSSRTQHEFLQKLLAWEESYGVAGARPWLQEKIVALRPKDYGAGARGDGLTLWSKSLEMQGPPTTPEARKQLLETLRQLWIQHPLARDGLRVRALSERLGVSAEFRPPALRDLNVDELLVRAKAQVRSVDAPGALRTLSQVLKRPREEKTSEALWTALQLHTRVLRIADQRHLIPSISRGYIQAGKMMDAPAAKADLKEFLSHGVDLTRMAWSYDTVDHAKSQLELFLKKARDAQDEGSIAALLYLKARILEQEKNPAVAQAAFDDALALKLPQDLGGDLRWRNLALQFDRTRVEGRNPAAILEALEPLKKYLVDKVDKSRWHYWRAQALLLQPGESTEKIEEAASEEFKKAYEVEPYSFYSNLAGLELVKRGHKPSNWQLEPGESYDTPNFDDFFSTSDGVANLPAYRNFAKSYGLASIGDVQGAAQVAREGEAEVWDLLLSSKSPVRNKQRFSRALSWLRLAVQDPMGSLKIAEIARQGYGQDFESEDLLYLYPLPYWDTIQAEAAQKGVNPWLAASLIRQESAFNPRARSPANALGLMQMIPSVARFEAKNMGLKDFQIEELYQPNVALKLGITHLSGRLNEMDGSWILATAAYNAGSPPVMQWWSNYDTHSPVAFIERISFAETRNYVRAILRNYMNYRRIYGGGKLDGESIVRLPERRPSSALTSQIP